MEDKHIIEAQQRVIDEDPSLRLHAIAADVALSHFRATLARLVAEEQVQAAARPVVDAEPVRPHEMLLRF
jgi:vanillate O-demethylase monooxygenase subunit